LVLEKCLEKLILFFFGSTGIWTQGFEFARQVLYYLNHILSQKFLLYFSGRILCFCLGLASDWNSPTQDLPCSWDSGHMPLTWLVCWGGILLAFCLAWPQMPSFQSLPLRKLIWQATAPCPNSCVLLICDHMHTICSEDSYK
jgi:hypothetical protein